MVTVRTSDGGRLELTPVGELVDIRLRDGAGRTVATVTKTARETALLLGAADELADAAFLPRVLRVC